MVRRFGDGIAAGADLSGALEAAITQALEPLDGTPPDLLAVFVCGIEPAEVDAVLPGALAAAGAAHSIGCSSAGVVGVAYGYEGVPAVSVWAAVLPGLALRAFHLEVMKVESGMAVVGLPERRPDEAVALLLADAFSFPTGSFLSRTGAAMPGLSVVGGLAAGMQGPGSTRLVVDGRVFDRGAVGMLLGGDNVAGAVRPVVSQGCRPIGPDMTVTAADGNVLLEVAGTPAMERLQRLLAELPVEEQARFHRSPQIGLALDEYAEEHSHGDFLIRAVLGVDLDKQGISVGETLHVGQTVRFHVIDAEAAGADLRATLAEAGAASGALMFSCAGRGQALFGDSDHEIAMVRELTGAQAVAGAYTGGEVGPVRGHSQVHGLAASVLLFT